MLHANLNQHHQSTLVDIHTNTLVIRDYASLMHTIPLNEIVGYGLPLNTPSDCVDVILHNGSRIVIESQHPHDLAQALDARLG